MQSVLDKRVLGTEGLVVPALGIACGAMLEDARDDVETMATLHMAFDLGLSFIDTEPGEEQLLARAIKGRHNKVVLSLTIQNRGPSAEYLRSDRSPARLTAVVNGSLARLGVDHLDVLSVEPAWTAAVVEELAGAMADLIRVGKVRYIGLTHASAQAISRAHQVHPLSVVHDDYSVWDREVESAVAPLLRQLGVGLVARSPLGNGVDVQGNPRLEEALRTVGRAHDASPGQVALAWLLHRSGDVVPLPSSARRSTLIEHAEALELTLSGSQRALLDAASALQPSPVVAGTGALPAG